MLLFRSEGHVDNWCRLWNQPRGALLTMDQAWGLASAWYTEDRRDPSWRRKSVDAVEALFSQLGLTSDFWRLR